METKARKIAPPRLIAAIVEKLIPKEWREDTSGDWRESYRSRSQYIWNAAQSIPVIVAGQVRRTFDITMFVGEAGTLCIAFAAAPLFPLVFVLAVALSVLVVRDAYIHPANGSSEEAATDAIVTVSFIILSQGLIRLVAPWLALPPRVMIRGAVFSLFMMSCWRTIFRRQPSPSKPQQRSPQLYRVAARMNGMWISACMALLCTAIDLFPAKVPGRDFLYIVTSMLVFTLAYRLQMSAPLGRSYQYPSLSLRGDPYTYDLAIKKEILWGASGLDRKAVSGFPWSASLEVTFFVLLALPLCIAFWSWLSGNTAGVDWMQMGATSAAFVTLSVLWVHIKRFNRKTARAIQAELNALGASENNTKPSSWPEASETLSL